MVVKKAHALRQPNQVSMAQLMADPQWGTQPNYARRGCVNNRDLGFYERRTVTEVEPFRYTFGAETYEVRHDLSACWPFGLFRVYTRGVCIGATLSHPTLDDCQKVYHNAVAQK